jgi:hypothetical protein
MSSLGRFENKNIFLDFKKALASIALALYVCCGNSEVVGLATVVDFMN